MRFRIQERALANIFRLKLQYKFINLWYTRFSIKDRREQGQMSCSVINLEQGMPTVENARIRLDQALRSARAKKTRAVKIIHGYGSSGKGGAIKRDVQKVLGERKRAGTIAEYVPGEQFSPFDESARRILSVCPELSQDKDYSRCNHGVTIVLL